MRLDHHDLDKQRGRIVMSYSRTSLLLLLFVVAVRSAFSQTPYKLPPREIVQCLDAPPPPRGMLSPARDAILLVEYQAYPSIEKLAEPVLRLGGLRINPRTGSTQRLVEDTVFSIQPPVGAKARRIVLPDGGGFHAPMWSHDGKQIALAREVADGLELWVAVADTGAVRRMDGVRLNDVLGNPVTWLRDNRHILAVLVPAERGPVPPAPRAPSGPNVQESSGRLSQMPTFQDLISNPHEADLFEHFATGQLAKIDTATGAIERIGPPGLITSADPSPDENFLCVRALRRPFSYRVPYVYFARTTQVWDASGKPVATIADLPVSDDVPRQGVPKGPRSVTWQTLRAARLIWVEALDGGDPHTKAPHRDKVMALDAPFRANPAELLKIQHRFAGFAWLAEQDQALLTEYDRDRRWITTAVLDLTRPEAARRVLFDRSMNDAYNDPGNPLRLTRPDGVTTVLQDGDSIYLVGQGAAPAGARPFLDRLNLKTGEKSRLFHCREHTFEIPFSFLGDSRTMILTAHETKSDPPNFFTLDLQSGKRTRLTAYDDPAPEISRLKKELITYRRNDGVELSGTLYLPADYKEGTRLPLIIWAYPLDYSDPATAGQVRSSPYTFSRVRGPSELFFVTQGYALLDDATMPVVGNPETMNDTYVEQICSAARAAIETLDKKGVIDPKRVGIAGHSYGAFMTANLLAHSDLFAAGIARSGAYNRSLTPFGFQTERRSYWEATDLYTKMSPFTYAHRISEPILLIHGEADNNPGTFPIQSERMFQAIKGNGGTARLVLLPHESHGYRARESVLHVLAEMLEWSDRYVKNRSDVAATAPRTSEPARGAAAAPGT
jgi:dipeptidyl aminopeptidase/acylaminoacyl peptidase